MFAGLFQFAKVYASEIQTINDVTRKCSTVDDCIDNVCFPEFKKVCFNGLCQCKHATYQTRTSNDVKCSKMDDCKNIVCFPEQTKTCLNGVCECLDVYEVDAPAPSASKRCGSDKDCVRFCPTGCGRVYCQIGICFCEC